jgi:hypothetical protein
MSTRWKGNFIKFSMEQYFGICSVMYTWENPRKNTAEAGMAAAAAGCGALCFLLCSFGE